MHLYYLEELKNIIDSKLYWDKRALENGHTGWNDYSIYFYDQKVRLNLIKDLLEKKIENYAMLLDYGCGTGDFSQLASRYFKKVNATDISEEVLKIAQGKNKEKSVNFFELTNNIFDYNYDCILSITVLQHILSDDELEGLILNFYKATKLRRGKIIILETIGDIDKQENSYLKFRDFNSLKNIFEKYGFECECSYNFYNPLQYESRSFNIYKKNILIKILRRLSRKNILWAKTLLKIIANYIEQKFNGIVLYETKTKVIIFKNKG